MVLLYALLGCGTIREGGGTAVGNPSKTAIRIAPVGVTPFDSASADLELQLLGCNGTDTWSRSLGVTDLIAGPVVDLPGGSWCSFEIGVRDLDARGEPPITVASAQITLDVSGVVFDGADLIVELGEPEQSGDLQTRSAVYREVQVDRKLDSIERSAGPLAAGDDRTPDAPEPTVMMVVGAEGFRSPQLAEPGPYDVDDGGAAFLSVAHAEGLWVTVGSYSDVRSAASIDNGQTWTEGDLENFSRSVHAHDGEFIAPSPTGGIAVTEDGITWTVVHSAGVTLSAAASSATRTVVVGEDVVLYADDARTWTRIDLPDAGWFRDVAWGEYGWVAVGDGGTIWHSADGISWADTTPGDTNLQAITWSGSRYVAVGAEQTWASDDGQTWIAGENKSLNGIGVHAGGLYATSGAFIFQSPDDGLSWEVWRTLDVPWVVGIGSNTP